MSERIVFLNGCLITPFRTLRKGSVIVKGSKIERVGASPDAIPKDAITIDVDGCYILPGFIDIHVHGGAGADAMDASLDAIEKIVNFHAKGGTCSIVLSTVTASKEEILRAIEAVRKAKKELRAGAKILGIHLEGPYLSMKQKGAHNPKYIRDPSPEEYEEFLKYSEDIVRVTVAPELKGALELGRRLRERGILPCIGHSDATLDEVAKAMEVGYSHVTHIYSCTSTVKVRGYKIPGVIEASFLFDELTVEIIADGKHLPPSLIRLILKIKGIGKVCAVTDAVRVAGLPPGTYEVGGLKVLLEEDGVWLPDHSAFAGSIATMDVVIRYLVKDVGLSLEDAAKLVTINPARIIGIDREKGSLTEGKDADIVVLDKDLRVVLTMVEGRIVYKSEYIDAQGL